MLHSDWSKKLVAGFNMVLAWFLQELLLWMDSDVIVNTTMLFAASENWGQNVAYIPEQVLF